MLTATGVSRAQLETEGRRLVRQDGRQVLLVAAGGRVFAIANRCPHEGHPLSEGTLGPGCVLTCNWHNWKFDLAGAALVGRDPVRTRSRSAAARSSSICATRRPRRSGRARRRARSRHRRWRSGADGARGGALRAGRVRCGREAVAHGFRGRHERLEDGMTMPHAAAAPTALRLAAGAGGAEERLAALLEPPRPTAFCTPR